MLDKRYLPIVLAQSSFIPLKDHMHLSIGDAKSIAAITHLAGGALLTPQNDADKFLGNIAIVFHDDPESCDNFESIKERLCKNHNSIAVEARISSCRKLSETHIVVYFQALYRIAFVNFIQDEPFFRGNFERVQEHGLVPAILDRVKIEVYKTIDGLVEFGFPKNKWTDHCGDPNNPSAVVDTIIFNSIDILGRKGFIFAQLRHLMSEINVARRWQRIADKLGKELDLLQVERNINNKVHEVQSKQQQEYILRQRKQKVEKELEKMHPEDSASGHLADLEKRIKESQMPEHAAVVAGKAFSRLKMIDPKSSEFNVASDYLNWLVGVPWHKRTEDNFSPSYVRQILDEDHYDLDKIKKRIVEYVAIRKLNPGKAGPILCLVGPPGVGKTSIGQSLGRALGKVLVRKSLGGVKDEAEIRGHRRTYVGALPGFIIQYMKKAGVVNPIFVLDEVDKMASDFRGDPASALLEVLDPEQNRSFSDNYLEVEYDLSQVMWICTANYLPGIPPTLRDRMEIIELSGYVREQKLAIAKKFLVPKQLKETGVIDYIGPEFFTDDALSRIIANYTEEAGVRSLEREIVHICSDVAIKIASNKEFKKQITGADLFDILGTVKHQDGDNGDLDMPGVVTGLAVTAIEGCTMTIGSCKMPGKGKLEFTGGLQDVMRESVSVAFTCAKRYLAGEGMNLDFLNKTDIHVQFEEGAIPKDGPSAGAAITLTLISLLTGRKVRQDLALTGEITLRGGGSILPVGGIKNKVLAAKRAGKKVVFIPEQNKKDLPDIPDSVKQKLDIRLAKNLKEIVDFALL
ncbi:MAG: endopeptidase La [bacterium]